MKRTRGSALVGVALICAACAIDGPAEPIDEAGQEGLPPPILGAGPTPPGEFPPMPAWPFRPHPDYPPAVSSWGGLHLSVAVVDTNQRLWHVGYEQGAWSAWTDLGGVNTSAPAIAPTDRGGPAIMARGSDDALWVRWREESGRWGDWFSLGGIHRSAPGAAYLDQQVVERRWVAAVGSDGGLWYNTWDSDCGCWSRWNTRSGPADGLKIDPASTVAWFATSIFARGARDDLVVMSGRGEWTNMGIRATSGPAIADFREVPNFAVQGWMLVVRGEDRKIWYALNTDLRWEAWKQIESGFPMQSGPVAVAYNHHPTRLGEVAVFAFDPDFHLRKRSYYVHFGEWSAGWEDLGGP